MKQNKKKQKGNEKCYYGIELNEPLGDCNGKYDGIQYFKTKNCEESNKFFSLATSLASSISKDKFKVLCENVD